MKPISEETAKALIDRAWNAGLRYFDTAPLYGHGLSELRIGQNLRWRPRDAFVLSTKVGRLLDPAPRQSIDFAPWVDAAPFKPRFDYSYDAAMRSIEHSLQRLALERIDIAFVHDCDVFTHGAEQQKIYFKQALNGACSDQDFVRDAQRAADRPAEVAVAERGRNVHRMGVGDVVGHRGDDPADGQRGDE